MLGLPSSGAGAWTLWSVLALTVTMVMMTLSGWMLLESFQHHDMRVSFNTVTRELLGEKLNLLNNLSVYFVGGILLYAYITSSGAILQGILGIDSKLASVLFVALFSAVVWHSTRAVDRISVVLIAFMILSFALGVAGLLGSIKLPTLLDLAGSESRYAPLCHGDAAGGAHLVRLSPLGGLPACLLPERAAGQMGHSGGEP